VYSETFGLLGYIDQSRTISISASKWDVVKGHGLSRYWDQHDITTLKIEDAWQRSYVSIFKQKKERRIPQLSFPKKSMVTAMRSAKRQRQNGSHPAALRQSVGRKIPNLHLSRGVWASEI